MTKVIIDTDLGDDVDDILAIAFALRRPELEVLGITTNFGGVEQRCKMAAKLLSTMGIDGVTVACGRSLPLNETRIPTQRMQGTPYQGAFADDVPDQEWPDAVDYILETVNRHPGEVGLITIGPMINAGAALQRDPQLGRKLKFIAAMGGNTESMRGEYNVRIDPESVDLVLNSGARIFLGTWTTTRRVVILPPDQARIAAAPTPLAQALSQNIELWRPKQGAKPGPVMYDLAPIVWAFQPDLYPTEPRRVDVELKGEHTLGWTIPRSGEPNVELSVDVKSEDVLAMYMDTILRDA